MNVIVIGGGAAGMMAAVTAAQNGHRVILLEKNEKLGKKVFITGKGRCNVTNACDTVDFFDQVIHNPKSLYSAVYSFDAAAVMKFMEDNGCPLKIERGNRVFPVSDHSSDIIRACSDALRKNGVQIRLNTKVEDLLIQSDQITGVHLKGGEKLSADAVVLATGGLSYPVTGSDGDGLDWAAGSGHEVTECKPALVPFNTKENFCRELQGLSLKNVTGTLYAGEKKLYSELGEMMFTHFGITGPLVLSASSYYSDFIAKCHKKGKELPEMSFEIDLKPALSAEQLDKRILREFEAAKNKQFKNAVEGLFPAKLLPVMIEQSGISPEKPVHEITKEERLAFAERIRHLRTTITDTRSFTEAIITQGGVSMKEVNPSTMESKRIRHLFFAGEMLDVDALTGGYNLQIAWSTGYLAGSSIE